MDLDNFDKDLIKQLKDHKMTLDKDQLWADIENKRKKPRRFLWLFLLPLFLVCGYFALQFFSTSESKTNVLTEKQYVQKENIIAENAQSSPKEVVEDDASIISQVDQIGNTNTNIKANTNANREQKNNITKTIKLDNGAQVVNSRTTQRSSPVGTANTIKQIKPSDLNLTNTPVVDNGTKKNVKRDEAILNHIKQESIAVVNEESSLLPIASLQSNVFIKSSFDGIPRVEALDIDKFVVGNPWTASFYVGAGIQSQNKINKSEASMEYRDIRDQHEFEQEELSLGLGLEYFFGDNFYLRSGIEYQRLAWKFNYVDFEEVGVTEEVPIEILIGPNPDSTSTRYGLVEGMQKITTTYNYYNNFHVLDIPIIAGYAIKFGKCDLRIEGGILANTQFSFTGHIFNKDFEIEKEPNYYKSRVGIRYTAGASMVFHLSDKNSFFIRPSYIIDNADFSNDENLIKEKTGIARVQLGYNYKF